MNSNCNCIIRAGGNWLDIGLVPGLLSLGIEALTSRFPCFRQWQHNRYLV